MKKNTALAVAGVVFGLIFLAHVWRLFAMPEITVANYIVPMWVSWVGGGVALVLSILMFSARRK